MQLAEQLELVGVGLTSMGAIVGVVHWAIKKELEPLQVKIHLFELEIEERNKREDRHFKLVMGKLDEIKEEMALMAKDYISADELAKEQKKCPARCKAEAQLIK